MSLSRKHLTVFALLVIAACTEGPTEPRSEGALPGPSLRFAMPAGASMASYGIVIDSVEVAIYQADTSCVECCTQCESPRALVPGSRRNMSDSTLLDTIMAWPSTAGGFAFSYEIPPPPALHAYYMYIGLRANGQEMFYGYVDVDFDRGRIVIPVVDLFYYGPGYLADSVAITQVDTVAQLNDTLQFDATAFQGGVSLDTAYIGWRTTDTTKARIDYTGQLTFRPAMAGSTVGVVALIPNGVSDTILVTAPAASTAIERTSGHNQSAPASSMLPAPIRARVLRSGGLPNPGVAVRFYPLGSTGTTVTDSIVFTDSLGYAETGVVLGAIVGGVDVEAFVVTSSSVKTTFHATIGNAVSAPILWVSDSFGVTGRLRQVQANGNNRATVLPLSTSGIQQALPRWAPNRLRAAYSSYNGNFNVLWITKASGDSSASYVNDISAFRPRYSPDGTHIAFQCGSIQDDEQTGDVCVGGGVTGAMNGLTGAGNAGSRVLLTDKVATRSNGPTSYAWNPVVTGRIAIVRDSVADTTGYVQSAIYRIDQTGTGVALLSAPVMDVGNGPLKVVGPMDWSPDGTRIVFAARDPNENESSLYLLAVATGAVTRLTTAPPGSFGDNGDRLPVFSPNGTEVLFLRIDYSGDGMGADWHVVRVNNGAVRQVGYEGSSWVTSDPSALAADWSPNGQTLLLPGAVSFLGTLYLVPSNVSSNAAYVAGRVLIGDANGSNNLSDQVGSWRP